MYQVTFYCSDSSLNRSYSNVESIEQHDGEWKKYSGDQLLEHHFLLTRNFYLHTKDSSILVSCGSIICIDITKMN